MFPALMAIGSLLSQDNEKWFVAPLIVPALTLIRSSVSHIKYTPLIVVHLLRRFAKRNTYFSIKYLLVYFYNVAQISNLISNALHP